jgi:Nuclease A inhibitor-like protein
VKPSNEHIKSQLRETVKGLGRSFGWDGEIRLYFWEVAEKGELAADKILLENKVENIPSIRSVSLDEYINWLAARQKRFGGLRENRLYTLAELLESNLAEFQIYQAYYLDDIFHFYVGRIDDIWFGLCETFPALRHLNRVAHVHRTTSDKFLVPKVIGCDMKVAFLLEELRRNDFLTTSKFGCDGDLDLDLYMWGCAATRSLLIERLLTLARFLTRFEFVDLATLKESVRLSGDTEIEENLGLMGNYQALEQYLQENLTDQQVFVIGPPSQENFDLYVLGRDQDDDWAGVAIHVGLL